MGALVHLKIVGFSIVFLLCHVVDGNILVAQHERTHDVGDVAENVIRSRSSTGLEELQGSFNDRGELQFERYLLPFTTDFFLNFFENDSIVKELELVDGQESQYRDTVQTFRESLATLSAMISQGNASQSKQLAKEVLKKKQQFDDGISGVLLPHQSKTLAQIQLRFFVRRYGLNAFLKNPAVKNFAGLNQTDVNRMRGIIVSKRVNLAQMIVDHKSETIESLLADFKEFEKQLIIEKWPYLASNKPQDAELFRIHYAALLNVEKSASDSEKVLFEMMAGIPDFKLDVTGNFVPTKARNANADIYIVKTFFSLLKDQRFLEQILVTDDQLAWFDQLKADFDLRLADATKEYRQAWDSLPRDKSFSENSEQEKRKLREQHAMIAGGIATEIKSGLSKVQWSEFEEIVGRTLTRRLGPIYDIISGQLGDRLQLTGKQKIAFQKKAETILNEHEKETNEIEASWLNTVFEVIDEEKTAKLRELLGPKTKYCPVSFVTYLTLS